MYNGGACHFYSPTKHKARLQRVLVIESFHLCIGFISLFLFSFVSAPNLRTGVQSMIHLAGLGKMRPNTVVMGFKNNWTDKRRIDEVVDYLGVINGRVRAQLRIDYPSYERETKERIHCRESGRGG